MSTPTPTPTLNIAIIGAGIAGLTAAIALLQNPQPNINTNIQIYERATSLREIGASIALGPNGLRTLERLALHDALDDAIAYRGPSGVPMIYKHWATNEVLGEDRHGGVVERRHRTARYLRAHLQEVLLRGVPRERVHLGKEFRGLVVRDGGVVIEFVDGEVVEADLVVAADGLHSGVRQFLVPDLKLKWSGHTAFRSVFSYDLVKHIPDLPLDSVHWWGPHTNFFASILGKNKYTVVGGLTVDPATENPPFGNVAWDQAANVQLLKDLYKDWNPIVKALAETTPDLRFYPNLSISAPLQTWVFGSRITLIGDAAHAHGGAYATGGSLAIDDAYALSLAIAHVFPPSRTSAASPSDLGRALRLYEATRKPHAEKLLAIVHRANAKKAASVGREVGDEELRRMAGERAETGWLHEHDVVAAFEEVVRREGEGKEEAGSARL